MSGHQELKCERCKTGVIAGTARIAFGQHVSNDEIVVAIVSLSLCETCYKELKSLERKPELLRHLVQV